MHTYRTALALVGATVPAHLVADAEVPVLTGPQAQGDLMIIPASAKQVPETGWQPVEPRGIPLVRGEAGGNTHWLHRGFDSPDRLTLGYLRVPAGQSAQLIHTDEHGANGIGPGLYRINRKREQVAVGFRRDEPEVRVVDD